MSIPFVIRLSVGSHPPRFYDGDGRPVALRLSRGKPVVHQGVWYKGCVRVNVIGVWRKGFGEPLWVMSDLEAEKALAIYLARMKIDQAFRDLKSLPLRLFSAMVLPPPVRTPV